MKVISRGKYTVLDNKIYGVCETCGKLVQANKFLFGSLHICRTDEEIKKHGKWNEERSNT